MVRVLIKTESHYPVNKKLIISKVEQHLVGKIHRDTEISIAVVGNRMMQKLNKKYRDLDKTTDVLSFPFSETILPNQQFIDPPNDNILRLGDIVVSYPEVVRQAINLNCLVDEVITELVLHGLDHLLGIHHPV